MQQLLALQNLLDTVKGTNSCVVLHMEPPICALLLVSFLTQSGVSAGCSKSQLAQTQLGPAPQQIRHQARQALGWGGPKHRL